MARQPSTPNPQIASLSPEERSNSIVVTPLSRYARQASTMPREASERADETAGTGGAKAETASRPPPARRARSAEAGATPASQSVVSLPALRAPEPPRKPRLPFWKRIALQRKPAAERAPAADAPSVAAPAPDLAPVLRQLASLEKQLQDSRVVQREQLKAFEENLTRMWQLEEQIALTEVRERLALLEASQEEVADGLHAVSRNLSILAAVLGLGLATAAFSLGILL